METPPDNGITARALNRFNKDIDPGKRWRSENDSGGECFPLIPNQTTLLKVEWNRDYPGNIFSAGNFRYFISAIEHGNFISCSTIVFPSRVPFIVRYYITFFSLFKSGRKNNSRPSFIAPPAKLLSTFEVSERRQKNMIYMYVYIYIKKNPENKYTA